MNISRLKSFITRIRPGGAVGKTPALLLVLLLAAAGCGVSIGEKSSEERTGAGATATRERTTPTGGDGEREPTVETISNTISRIRGLPLTGEVAVSYINREQLARELKAEMEKSYPPAELAADEKVLKLLGLLEPEDDLAEEIAQLLSGGVAGFYDDETKQLKIVSENAEIDAVNEITLAHELTHALQDQHFGLGPFIDAAGGDADLEAARLALVEGEATLVEEEYMERVMGAGDLAEAMLGSLGAMGDLGDTPPYLVNSLMFPYLEGADFVAFLREREEWESVNEAYERPPASTEQILHPQKYLAGEAPVPVSIPDLGDLAGPGWTATAEDTLGEFDASEVLARELPAARSLRAARGWGGGAYRLYQNGDQALLAILMVWDSTADADEFSTALGAGLEHRYGSRFDMAAAVPALNSADGAWFMAQRGTAVAAVVSPNADAGSAAVRRMLGI